MALETAAINGKIVDLLGTAGVRATITFKPVTTHGAILPDTTGDLRFGPHSVDTATDGSVTLGDVSGKVTLPKLPQAGYEDYRWHVAIEPHGVSQPRMTMTFELVTNTTWRAIVETVVSGVPITPSALQQALDARDDVLATLAEVEDARDDAEGFALSINPGAAGGVAELDVDGDVVDQAGHKVRPSRSGTRAVGQGELFVHVMDKGALGDSTGPTGTGTDDTPAFQQAIDAGAAAVFVPAGRRFRINGQLNWDDSKGALTIIADGATIDYRGSSSCLKATMAPGPGRPTTNLRGGIWVGTASTVAMFEFNDVRRALWHRVRVDGCSTGIGWWIKNVNNYSERVQILDCEERDNKTAVSIDASGRNPTGGTTGTASFARLIISNFTVQGGVSGACKIDISSDAAPYGGLIAGIRGNINDNVRIMKLAGALGGTALADWDVEALTGTTGYLFHYTSDLSGKPLRRGSFTLRQCLEYAPDASPPTGTEVWAQTDFPNGLTVKQQGSYNGIEISRRRTAIVDSPVNPQWYMSGGNTGAYPFTGFGQVIEQLAAGKDKAILDGAGNLLLALGSGGKIGFLGKTPIVRPSVAGSRGTDAMLQALLTALANLGLISDTTTAALGGSFVDHRVRQTDAPAVNNSTALVTDSVITFPLAANTLVTFDGIIRYDASTTADLKFGWDVPAGVSGFWTPGSIALAATGFNATPPLSTLAIASDSGAGGAGVGTIGSARFSGTFWSGPTAGNFALHYAQNSQEVSDVTVRAGTHVNIRSKPL